MTSHSVPRPEQFTDFCWHDNAIHGFRLIEGSDGCSGELVLDIDYIVEWLAPKGGDNRFGFRVAPADLRFHEVTDLIISIDYASSHAAFQPMVIHAIQREVMIYPNGFSSFAWRIEINWPENSYISFRANGFTQLLRAEPIISNSQSLPPSQRKQ